MQKTKKTSRIHIRLTPQEREQINKASYQKKQDDNTATQRLCENPVNLPCIEGRNTALQGCIRNRAFDMQLTELKGSRCAAFFIYKGMQG